MKVKVGQKYKVQSWESMKRKFGSRHISSLNEYIDCCASFVGSMRKYCGSIVTIEYIHDWNSNFFDIKEDDGAFTWSTDMVMPIGGLHEAIQSRRHCSDSSVGGYG